MNTKSEGLNHEQMSVFKTAEYQKTEKKTLLRSDILLFLLPFLFVHYPPTNNELHKNFGYKTLLFPFLSFRCDSIMTTKWENVAGGKIWRSSIC